jgi:tetratricopeptide (TPR) repeat protein
MSKSGRTTLPIALCAAVGLVALCSSVQPARAGAGQTAHLNAAASPAKKQQAAARFAKAKGLYKAGKYRAAIEELEGALKLDPEGAELLYNLGVIHEKLTEVDKAIAYYKQYVEIVPDSQEKERVSSIIERLEGAKKEIATPGASASASASKPPPDTAPEVSAKPPTAPADKGRFDGLVIAAGVLAGAGLFTGAFFGVKAMGDRLEGTQTTNESTRYQDLQSKDDKARKEALIADIGFGVALVAGVSGALLYFMRDAQPDETKARAPEQSRRSDRPTFAMPSVAITPGGVTAGFGMRF